jgi:ABC-2 type transport system permease protein
MNPHVVLAIFKRNLKAYFSSPTGYLFICVFVLACAFATYWPNEFFIANLANFDQLNNYLPYIMLVFIPAITMSIWAEERRQGTDELLLTIPASDFDVVLGKYLAAVAIFTAALAFSLVNCVFLLFWGDPDLGLFLGTYIGYWMVGLAMLSVGMAASFLTSNLTIGFILGVVFNIPLVMLAYADVILPESIARGVKELSIAEQFRDFGRGMITFTSVLYFSSIMAVMLYMCMILIGRRHWWGGRDGHSLLGHYVIRAVALIAVAVGLHFLVAHIPVLNAARIDVTEEQLSSLAPRTRTLLAELKPERPIVIDAYVSPVVPEAYVQTRLNLLSTLREFQTLGGGKIKVNVHDTEPLSDQAVRAEQQFGIKPQKVPSRTRGAMKIDDIFLGVAFTSGLNKVVVPFLDKGIPVEYELVRSIGTVSEQKRKKIGVLTTDAKLYGGFNMQSFSQTENQAIIEELEKQYEVVQVSADAPITQRYDALLAVQPSSLTPEQMTNFINVVKSGQPTAIFEDPFPYFGYPAVPGTLAPKQPPGGMNPFMGQQPPQPKGDISPLWKLLGIDFNGADVIWQAYNPYPKAGEFPLEFVFIDKSCGAEEPFNPKDEVSAKLQELLFLFPGSLRRREASQLTFERLATTGRHTGTVPADKIVEFNQMNPNLALLRTKASQDYILAARIHGKDEPGEPSAAESKKTDDKAQADKAAEDGAKTEESDKQDANKPAGESKPDNEINVIVVADIDCLYSAFFQIRQRGAEQDADINLNLDNVTFVLNILDSLAGDTRFIDVRKRRQEHRKLTAIEELIAATKDEAAEVRKAFIDKFEDEKKAEQARLDKAVAEIESNKDLDPLDRARKLAMVQKVAQQRLDTKISQMERQRDREIKNAERNQEQQVRRIQSLLKVRPVILALVLPLALGAVVFVVLHYREREGVSKNRLR